MFAAVSSLFAASPSPAQQPTAPAPATQAQRAPAPAASRPVPRAQFIADMDAQFKRLDANGDGIATRLEIETNLQRGQAARAVQRNRQLFAALDKDRSGQLSAAEFAALAAAPQAVNAGPILTTWDLNKDGKVGLVEFRSATQANFDRMDTDRDGIVTVAEMRAAGIK
jgi:Ca2+-binding EF-hand superfamily protein